MCDNVLHEEFDDSVEGVTTSKEEHQFEENVSKPNDQTQAAFSEYMEMMDHTDKYKRYSSPKEMLDDVLSEA